VLNFSRQRVPVGAMTGGNSAKRDVRFIRAIRIVFMNKTGGRFPGRFSAKSVVTIFVIRFNLVLAQLDGLITTFMMLSQGSVCLW
jgi:hypothetical protein